MELLLNSMLVFFKDRKSEWIFAPRNTNILLFCRHLKLSMRLKICTASCSFKVIKWELKSHIHIKCFVSWISRFLSHFETFWPLNNIFRCFALFVTQSNQEIILIKRNALSRICWRTSRKKLQELFETSIFHDNID